MEWTQVGEFLANNGLAISLVLIAAYWFCKASWDYYATIYKPHRIEMNKVEVERERSQTKLFKTLTETLPPILGSLKAIHTRLDRLEIQTGLDSSEFLNDKNSD